MTTAPARDIHLCRAHDIRAGAAPIGARLLVDRLWPRGIAKTDLSLDAWLKDVAPSPTLRIWYGHDPAKWTEFRSRYLAELRDNPAAVESALAWCHKGPVSLIYAAKDTRHTHALVLRDHLAAILSTEKQP
jgi:uncharacterized protein YeaO (DUF488 family)